jgi:hypothetical protein
LYLNSINKIFFSSNVTHFQVGDHIQNSINEDIYVIDLETTGRKGFPDNVVVEVAIFRVNKNLSVEKILSSLISHDEDKKELINKSWWSEQSGVKYEETLTGKDCEIAWKEISAIISGKKVMSWNTKFDFNDYILPIFEFYNLPINFTILPCPMKMSADHVKAQWNSYFKSWKWPKLEEASVYYKIQLDGIPVNFHRAEYDTHLSSLIIGEMIKLGHYKF